jgi:hypothetical protein
MCEVSPVASAIQVPLLRKGTIQSDCTKLDARASFTTAERPQATPIELSLARRGKVEWLPKLSRVFAFCWRQGRVGIRDFMRPFRHGSNFLRWRLLNWCPQSDVYMPRTSLRRVFIGEKLKCGFEV